jgi:hypothetical protein
MRGLLLLAVLYLVVTRADAKPTLIDHGPTLPLASLRGAVAVQNAKGENLVIACSMDTSPQGWILVTNIDTGECKQVWVPRQYPNSPPYGSVLGSNGRFYTCEGSTFLEFDPNVGDWTYHKKTEDGCFIGVTESPDGIIYFGGCPNAHLISFDPKTKAYTDFGRMDPVQEYVMSLATDDAGWVYCGIGTARENLVAFNPKTKERRQLLKEDERQISSPMIEPGVDGAAYVTIRDKSYRLRDGQATEIPASEIAPRRPVNSITWGGIVREFPDGRSIAEYNMLEQYLVIAGPKAGETKRIPLEYKGDGSLMTMIAKGPGDRIYGGAAFPCSVLVFDPRTDKHMQRVGDLYWHCLDTRGTMMAAGRYAGGFIDIYDTSKPWNPGSERGVSNPLWAAGYNPDVNAPTGVFFHPDGRHVILIGIPGYGYVGGGIAVYDMETGTSELYKHEQLVPEQCMTAMRISPDGNLLLGTSTRGGHGTEAEGGEARLVIFDWKTRKITFERPVVKGATGVMNLEIGSDGLIYGVTDKATLFVFDPATQRIVRTESLEQYGAITYNEMVRAEDGNIYLVMGNAILRIKPGGAKVEKLADSPKPITRGIAVVGGRIYFICTSHLWSYGPVGSD